MKIGVVVKEWFRLSETFIAQEIFGLEQKGLDITVYSLRKPRPKAKQPIYQQIKADINHLEKTPISLIYQGIRALFYFKHNPNLPRLLKTFESDFCKKPSWSRLKRLFQALIFSREMAKDIDILYAHFLHTPSTFAYYVHLLTGKPWCFSAHAKDIWTSPQWDLKQKMATALWGNTCTAYNHAFLNNLKTNRPINLIYHGITLSAFSYERTFDLTQIGQDPDRPFQILTIARAVEKKGLDLLIEALSTLPKDLSWHWTHIGDGILLKKYKQRVSKLGLSKHVTFLGPLTQSEITPHFKRAHLFVLPCRISKNGDRDGLPNVLMEALAMQIPILSTQISAVEELIEDGISGILVEPDNISALKSAIIRLISDPDLRRTLALQGESRVKTDFTCDKGISELSQLFQESLTA
jgi:glycosyltransferase involved in cell wall biosynthesis